MVSKVTKGVRRSSKRTRRPSRKARVALARFLHETYARYNTSVLTEFDPIVWPRRFSSKADQEISGYIAASLAFGNVTSIHASCERAIANLGPHPSQRLEGATDAELELWSMGFNHRWIFAGDLLNLYRMLRQAMREHGGLEPLFAAGMRPESQDVRDGAEALVNSLGSYLSPDERGRRGTRYMLPQTRGPGAAKRMHMFLRWMIRKDAVDLGIWSSARPSQLLMPLDTHVARISRELGMTKRKTAGLGMVLDITERLREVDEVDPIRFDFALSRLGILRDGIDSPPPYPS